MEEKLDIEPEELNKATKTLEKISWDLISKYFKYDPHNLVAHQLDSYNYFFDTEIFNVFRDNNPIRFSEKEVEGKPSNKINLYMGGKDGKLIYFGKPILYDEVDERTPETYSHYMYPNEARLRNLTYAFSIHYDVEVDFDYYVNGENIKKTIIVPQILLGRFPIMLQSNLCILKGMATDLKYNLGECRNDPGGYFIIDGKEKVIVSQEKFADNMLYVSEVKDSIYSYVANIRSASEDTSKPKRTTSVRIVAPNTKYSNNNIVVSIPNVKKPIPLFIVMRALGVLSDKSIIETCLLNIETNSSFVNFFIPSIHDANKIFSQEDALCFIAVFTKHGSVSGVMEILMNYFLPHIGELNFTEKAYYLGYIVFELLKVYSKQVPSTDRDNFKYKRIEVAGTLIKDLFVEYYKIQKQKIFLQIDQLYYYKTLEFKDDKFTNIIEDNVHNVFKGREVEIGFKKAFKGDWGSAIHTKRIGILQDLNRLSYNAFISHLRKLNLPLDASAKVIGPRLLHSSQWGYIDPADSPDGGNIGLHKHMSIMTYINTEFSSSGIINWLYNESPEPILYIQENTNEELDYYTKVFVNGRWIGIVKDPVNLIQKIKLYKRNGILPLFMSCSFDYKNIISIYTDGGRLYRPIYYVDEVNKRISSVRTKEICEKILSDSSWERMVSGFLPKTENYHYKNNLIYNIKDFSDKELEENKAVIEYIDVSEEEFLLISNDVGQMSENKFYTNVEIHPSLLFGVVGNLIIYPENNPYPRNTFSCAHAKQAVSIYHSNYMSRIDKTATVLNYGHIPLIKSKYINYINKEEQPYGNNVICAIMSYNGYNVEDAILINEGSIQRGLFNTTYYTSYESREDSDTVKGKKNSYFTSIQDKEVLNTKPEFFYNYLDEKGMVRENTMLHDKIALIGKVSSGDNLYDESVFPKKGQVGYVDKSFITDSDEGFRIAKIRIREERIPAIGDKMASRCGQKGTVGLVIKESDMPFTEDGIRPDLIINPHAIPSRMTIGQLLEMLFGKLCSIQGCFGDCTAFNMKGSNLDFYGKCLINYGYHSSGNQILYNGLSGEQMKSEIFIGPCYYSRLKHMVKDKINYRSLGPKTALTRQSVQGRANDGGLRIGEMERDGVLAHGALNFLTDSFLKRGDEYYMAICNQSGMIAIYNKSQNIFLSPSADGPLQFVDSVNGELRIENISKFGKSFSIVRIPYALKLIIQELQVMNVQMRIITDDNIDQIEYMNYSKNLFKLNNENVKDENTENYIKNYLKYINSTTEKNRGQSHEILINDHPYHKIKDELYQKYSSMSPLLFEASGMPIEQNIQIIEPETDKPEFLITVPQTHANTPIDDVEIDDSRIKRVLNEKPHLKSVYDKLSMNTQIKLAGGDSVHIDRILTDVYNMVPVGGANPNTLTGNNETNNSNITENNENNIKKIKLN
jgi:DNA-directed RNA polymerase II subunit RPB2